MLEYGSETGQPFILKTGYFWDMDCCLTTENVQEIWPTKMDFDWPNAEIDRKMVNSQMLSLAQMLKTVENKNYWFLEIISW